MVGFSSVGVEHEQGNLKSTKYSLDANHAPSDQENAKRTILKVYDVEKKT